MRIIAWSPKNSLEHPSTVSVISQESLLLPKASRTGPCYQDKGMEDIPWLAISTEGSDAHLRSIRKMDVLLVLLVSTTQLLGPKESTPRR